MAYLSPDELDQIGFKSVGKDVKISRFAQIYDPHQMVIGDYSRIDDFCVVSGRVEIGNYVHITPMCLLAGGVPGIFIENFCTLAYGVKIFAQTDDYTGETLTNSLIPKKYKNETFASVILEKHVIVGTNAVIFPGVKVALGCALGAMSLVTTSTTPWGIYVGQPAMRKKERKMNLLKLEAAFLEEEENYSI